MPKPSPFSSTTKKAKKKKATPGRPKNVTETKKRKPKPKGKPSTKANIFTWSMSTYAKISEILNPVLVNSLGKDNMRKLTEEEASTIEYVKFGVLCHMKAFSSVSEDRIKEILSIGISNHQQVYPLYINSVDEFKSINDRAPNTDEVRLLYASAYAAFLSQDEEE